MLGEVAQRVLQVSGWSFTAGRQHVKDQANEVKPLIFQRLGEYTPHGDQV